jgi:MFS family permease
LKIATDLVVNDPHPANASLYKIESGTSFYSWLIWGAAALFYLYEYILRSSPGVITNELMRDFSINSTALGIFTSAYYLAYVPLQVPCGIIVDWLGARKVVTISALLCTVGAFAHSYTLPIALFARFLIGAGSACAYLSCLKVASDWFPAQRFAVIAGTTMMMGTFGGIFGGKPLAMLVNATDWRTTITIAAFVGIAVTAVAWFVMKDRPARKIHSYSSQQVMTYTSLVKGLKIIASNPQNWLIGIYASLMYTILSAFAEQWGTPYLMITYELNNETAAYGSTLIFIGMALGCFISPILANYLQSHRKIMSWGALGAMVTFTPAIYLDILPLYGVFALLFCSGFFCGWQILNFAAAKEINPPEFNGTTMGFMNALTMTSALIFQPLLGMLIDLFEEGAIGLDGLRIYSADAYQSALLSMPAGLLAAWVVLRFVRETHPDHRQKG